VNTTLSLHFLIKNSKTKNSNLTKESNIDTFALFSKSDHIEISHVTRLVWIWPGEWLV